MKTVLKHAVKKLWEKLQANKWRFVAKTKPRPSAVGQVGDSKTSIA